MINKRGFTLVELITTFALAAVIIVLLINIIVVIRNIYSKTDMKTELYINQSNLSNAMNEKISEDNLLSYEECNDTEFCYIFNFYDDDSVKLSVDDNTITFGTFVYKLNSNSKIVNPSVTKEHIDINDTSKNDSFLIIKIPITCSLYPDIDFGINLVYPYNSNKISL